jgi:hypothetical protein
VPRADGKEIYAGAYYGKVLGLRWQHGPPHAEDGWRRPSRISAHGEVRQATSGRAAGEPWAEGAGRGYWAAAERARLAIGGGVIQTPPLLHFVSVLRTEYCRGASK